MLSVLSIWYEFALVVVCDLSVKTSYEMFTDLPKCLGPVFRIFVLVLETLTHVRACVCVCDQSCSAVYTRTTILGVASQHDASVFT